MPGGLRQSSRVKPCSDCGASFPVSTCRSRCDGCREARAKAQRVAGYQRNKHKIKSRWKISYSQAPERFRGYHYKHRYGLTKEEVEAMYAAQGEACAICAKPVPLTGARRCDLAYVDHCHATGKVRGLLCMKCNMLLGAAQDQPATLLAAIAYLERQ